MKKPVVNHLKAHMSLCGRPAGPAAACGCQRLARVPRTAAARAGCPAARPAAGVAVAAVRPGRTAACIVEAAVAEAGGGPATAGAGTVPAAGRDGRTQAGICRAGTPGEPSRRLRRQAVGGSRSTGRGRPRQSQRNGQMEHSSQAMASMRKVVRRGAAITPRERADAQDLLLTTLSNEPCVQSSIFGFVTT